MTNPNLTEAARKCAEELRDRRAVGLSVIEPIILRHFTALQEQWGKDKERLEQRVAELEKALADERTEMNSVPRWEPILCDGTKHGATMEFRADGAFICYAHATAALAKAQAKGGE